MEIVFHKNFNLPKKFNLYIKSKENMEKYRLKVGR